MKLFYIFCIFLTSLYSQIQHGGIPKGFDYKQWTQMESITLESLDYPQYLEETRNNDEIKYFVYGYPHIVNIDFFKQATKIDIDGGSIYFLSIESDNAFALSLHYSDFYLSEGTQMYIYNEENDFFIGSFNHLNNKDYNQFSTQLVKGSKSIIEIFVPKNVENNSRVVISKVVHDFTDLLKFYSSEDRVDCNINVVCDEGDGYRDIINSVLMLDMGGGYCSASLVNNTAYDLTPYILTADHCITGNTNNYTLYFNYQSNSCQGSTGSLSESLSGASLKVSGSASDFALLEWSVVPPEAYEPFYTGWNNSSSASTDAVAIHHPNADIKKITIKSDNESIQGNGNYWEFQFDNGRVVPGSSGSPLFDGNKRQIGIASYIYTNYCDPSPDCYCSQQYDHGYGRFDRAWDAGLDDYLDPLNSNVTTLDGTAFSGVYISHNTLDDQPYNNGSVTFSTNASSYSGMVSQVQLFVDNGMGFNQYSMNASQNGYTYQLTGLSDGSVVSYYFRASDSEGNVALLPSNAPESTFKFVMGTLPVVFSDDFELSQGWSIGDSDDTASSGIWELGNPNIVYADNGNVSQPGEDHSLDGSLCYVTGNLSNSSSSGADDVDGGKTTLFSPIFDLTNMDDARVSFWYWYSNNLGDNPGSDFWTVSVSNNAGQTWINIVNTSSSTNSWQVEKKFLSDYIELTNTMKFKFIAQDQDYGSLVEAALDDFVIESINAGSSYLIGDSNMDGAINIQDIIVIINIALGIDSPDQYNADTNQDGSVDILDVISTVNIILNN